MRPQYAHHFPDLIVRLRERLPSQGVFGVRDDALRIAVEQSKQKFAFGVDVLVDARCAGCAVDAVFVGRRGRREYQRQAHRRAVAGADALAQGRHSVRFHQAGQGRGLHNVHSAVDH